MEKDKKPSLGFQPDASRPKGYPAVLENQQVSLQQMYVRTGWQSDEKDPETAYNAPTPPQPLSLLTAPPGPSAASVHSPEARKPRKKSDKAKYVISAFAIGGVGCTLLGYLAYSNKDAIIGGLNQILNPQPTEAAGSESEATSTSTAASTSTASLPSSTPPPSPTLGSSPEPFTPTPSSPIASGVTPGLGLNVFNRTRAEMSDNVFLAGGDADDAVLASLNEMQSQAPLVSQMDGANSALTNLVNSIDVNNPDRFDPNPDLESGNGFQGGDIDNVFPVQSILENSQNITPANLLSSDDSEDGVKNLLLYGPGDARDAAALILATVNYSEQNLNDERSIDQIWHDPALRNTLRAEQLRILEENQERFIGPAERIPDDLSGRIPDFFRTPDPFDSCDVNMTGGPTRTDQTQVIRRVRHVIDGLDNHISANVETEDIVWSRASGGGLSDPDEDSFTARAISDQGYNLNAVVMQEIRRCGEGEEAPEQPISTATAPVLPTPIGTAYPSTTPPPPGATLTPTEGVKNTPTAPGLTPTVRPTRTPGHTPTFQPTMTEQPPLPTVTPLPTSTEAPPPTDSATMTAQPPEPTVTPKSPDPNDYARVVDTTRLRKVRNNAGYIFIAPIESRAERKAKSESDKSKRPFSEDGQFVIWDQKRRIRVEKNTYKDRRR